jgi:hypothetical protein
MTCFGKRAGCWIQRSLFVLVFFPADIADLAGEPTRHPMAEIRDHVFGTTSQALGLGCYFKILYFDFRHTGENSFMVVRS